MAQQSTNRERIPATAERRSTDSTDGEVERDETYGLVSVLYHALQGVETYGDYADDARRARDEDLVLFFEDCRDEEAERAIRARALLVERLVIPEEAAEDDD